MHRCRFWIVCFLLLGSITVSKSYGVMNSAQERDLEKATIKIVLPNGLQAVLISDPKAIDSFAALSVAAGTWDDPVEYMGMAHFVEHLLFLGTKKFPIESDFMRYVQERGGGCNASTFRDRSVYGFSIQSNSFEDALERFADFFVAPLFDSSAIEREKHAVHHEFEDSVENDFFRLWRVFKETGNPKHPNYQFSCGNLDSLEGISRRDVVSWFDHHYVSHEMNLVLVSSASLEKLTDIVCRLFSPISSGKSMHKKRSIEEPLTSLSQRGQYIYVQPSFRQRFLSLSWEIPREFLDVDGAKVLDIAQVVLQHGCRLLTKKLAEEGLCLDVQPKFWRIAKDHGLFRLHVLLTQKGLAHKEEVIMNCFQSLRALQQAYIADQSLAVPVQMKKEKLIRNYQEAMVLACQLLDENCHENDEEENLSMRLLDFLEMLSPRDCLYFILAPFEELQISTSHIEQWMRSEYFMRKVPEDLLRSWENSASSPVISCPRVNETNRDNSEEEGIQEESLKPIFLQDDAFARIRWVRGPSRNHRMTAFFCIKDPQMNRSLKNRTLHEVFIQMIREAMQQELGEKTDFECRLAQDGEALCLVVSCPKTMAKKWLHEVFFLLVGRDYDRESFQRAKKELQTAYVGDVDPLDSAQQIFHVYAESSGYTTMEVQQNIQFVSYEEYEQFRMECFSQLFLEGTFFGGVDQEEALSLWDELQKTFSSPIPYEEELEFFPFPKEDKSFAIQYQTHRKGNALLLLLAAQEEGDKQLHEMIASFVHGDFFHELRTIQQTAYKLYGRTEFINNRSCYSFGLQSSSFSSWEMLLRVEKFLADFFVTLSERFSEERMDRMQEALRKKGKIMSKEEILRVIRRTFSGDNHRKLAILIDGKESSSAPVNWLNEMSYSIMKRKFDE